MTDIAAPWPLRKKFDLTGPGKLWIKVTSGAFLARASRDKVTSELAWPRAESAEIFRAGKSLTLIGPLIVIAESVMPSHRGSLERVYRVESSRHFSILKSRSKKGKMDAEKTYSLPAANALTTRRREVAC